MTKIKIFIMLLLITLVSTGCTNNKVIDEQQKKIDYLTTQLASTTEQINILNEQNDTTKTNETNNITNTIPKNIPPVTSVNNTKNVIKETPAEDSLIKIERCKSEATEYADSKMKETMGELNKLSSGSCNDAENKGDCILKYLQLNATLANSEKTVYYNDYYQQCLAN